MLHPRHEQTAAYMALGAALVTGRPQAFAVVPGPGILNASAALLTAYGMSAPVIAIAGQIPSFAIDRGYGHLHEIHDQIGLLRHITKHAARITSPHEAPGQVADAIRAATSGRPGPVALECAIDTWGRDGGSGASRRSRRRLCRLSMQTQSTRGGEDSRPGGASVDRGGRLARWVQAPRSGPSPKPCRRRCPPSGAGAASFQQPIRLRCHSPKATHYGRTPMRCSPSARASTGNRASGALTTICRSCASTSTQRRSTASAAPPAPW